MSPSISACLSLRFLVCLSLSVYDYLSLSLNSTRIRNPGQIKHYIKQLKKDKIFISNYFLVFGSSELQPWAKQTPPTESQSTDQRAQEKVV